MNRIEKLIAELCPEGVEWKKLGEVANIDLGTQLNKTEMLTNGLYPVYNGGINPSGFYNEYNTAENSITISQGGASAGYVNYVSTKFWAGAHCFVVKPIEDNIINNRFLYFYLKNVQEKIQEAKHGAGIPGLNRNKLKSLPIPIPPLPIQEEIVKILDTFTALEAALEEELEARKKQYEYYRNKLLTPVERNGRWYLNGVEVEWKKLGEIGTLIRGTGLQKKDFTESGVGCIHYGQIYTYYGTFADRTISFVSETMAKKLKKAQKGDVLISGVSENIEDICKPLGWLGDEICISGDMFAFRHNQNTKYLTYLLLTNDFKNYKRKYAQGTKVIRVKPEKILNYNIPIPPLSEQERIVAILDKFDALVNDLSQGLPAEIEARRKQYEYYRNKLLNFSHR